MSVDTVAADRLPPPLLIVNATGTLRTPPRSAALTRTLSATGSAVPTTPLCPSPADSTTAVGTGCTVTLTVSACPVSVATTTLAIPRTGLAPSVPPNLLVTTMRVVSSDVHAVSVPGRAPPSESLATAVSVTEPLKTTLVSRVLAVTVLAFRPGPA